MSSSPKIGLALGSGGIRGLAHIGVLRVLEDAGIPIDYIAGSSIGAWIGARYAMNRDLETLEHETLGYKKEKMLSFLEPSFKGGFIKGEKLDALLRQWLGDTTFEELEIPLTVVAVDLKTGEEVHLDSGELTPAVQASMSIPLIFRPRILGEYVLVDGGIRNPLPADVVRAMGADIVIAVHLDAAPILPDATAKTFNSFAQTTRRSIDIMRDAMVKTAEIHADVIMVPQFPGRGVDNIKDYFIHSLDHEYIDAGVKAAEEVLPELHRLMHNM